MSDDFHAEHTLEIKTEPRGEAAVVHLSGHVDELGADDFGAALDKVIEDGVFQIIVDLTDVLFMGSTGLGQIIRTHRTVKKEGGYIRIVNPQPLIADIFRVTKINKLLNIYPSVEHALTGGPTVEA